MVFYTETGSVYEVDLIGKRIRRLRGKKDPQPRQGEDGKWKGYASISSIIENLPVLIIWQNSGEEDFIPTTLTSHVVDIRQEEN